MEFSKLREQIEDVDTTELDAVRQFIRPEKEQKIIQQLQNTYGKRFDSKMLSQSQIDVAKMLDETAEPVSIHQKLQQLQQKVHRQSLEKERSQER